MRKILELFTKKGIVLLALVIFCGPVFLFKLDERIGVIIMGVIFGLSGAGNIMVAQNETMKGVRVTQKIIGIFLLCTGILCAAASILLFVAGTPIH